MGNALSVLFFLACYLRRKTFLHLDFNNFGFESAILKEIFAVGIPVTTSQALISVAQMVQNNLAAGYGDTTVAALGISLKLMTIGTFIFMGFSAGCQPLMGFNYGSGNFRRLREFIKTGIIVTTLIGLGLLLTMWISAPYLVSTFTPLDDVQAAAATILRTLIFSLPFMGGITLCTTTFQAMGGQPIKAFILTAARQGGIFLYSPIIPAQSLIRLEGGHALVPTNCRFGHDFAGRDFSIACLTRVGGEGRGQPAPENKAFPGG